MLRSACFFFSVNLRSYAMTIVEKCLKVKTYSVINQPTEETFLIKRKVYVEIENHLDIEK